MKVEAKMTHDEIMERTMLAADGFVFTIRNRPDGLVDRSSIQAVAKIDAVNPEYLNLVAASGLLYRSHSEALKFLEEMVDFFEQSGNDLLVGPTLLMQAAMNTALSIALNGNPKKS